MQNDTNSLRDKEILLASKRVLDNLLQAMAEQETSFEDSVVFLVEDITPQFNQKKGAIRDSAKRLERKRSRDFEVLFTKYHKISSEMDCREELVEFIQKYFDRKSFLEARQISSREVVLNYAQRAFRDGCIDVNFWLLQYGVWILSGIRS